MALLTPVASTAGPTVATVPDPPCLAPDEVRRLPRFRQAQHHEDRGSDVGNLGRTGGVTG